MDIAELAQHVRHSPSDHEQRWRLAKKLYKNGQYAAAVEHLQIVRQYRDDKLHVVRFLAATFYRLERYQEAADELADAVAQWPEELTLREQWARALRMAGNARRLGFYGFGAAAHILIQVARRQGREVYAFVRAGDSAAMGFARGLGAAWAGGSDETPPQPLDAGGRHQLPAGPAQQTDTL